MPKRNVVLTDHQDAVVDRLVKSGRYRNASEVLREGLRLMEVRDAREAAKLAALRDAARIGFQDLGQQHFTEFGDGDLDGAIGELGMEASERAAPATR